MEGAEVCFGEHRRRVTVSFSREEELIPLSHSRNSETHRPPKAQAACPICSLDMDDLDMGEREDHVAAHLGLSPFLSFSPASTFISPSPPSNYLPSVISPKTKKT